MQTLALQSAASMLPHRRLLLQLSQQMAQEPRMFQWVRRAHTLAGAAITRLATSAGHLKVLSRGKVVIGSVLLEGEAFGVSNCDKIFRLKSKVDSTRIQQVAQCMNDDSDLCCKHGSGDEL